MKCTTKEPFLIRYPVAITVVLAVAFIITIIGLAKYYPRFYDGEGNEISRDNVQLLVKSQFVKITDQEKRKLDSVFYSKKH
jgi:hypothetical protein